MSIHFPAAAGVILVLLAASLSSCEWLAETDGPKKKPEKPVSAMSEKEYNEYIAREKARKQQKGFIFSGEPNSVKKRDRMYDDAPILHQEPQSVFPWKEEPGDRSGSLLEQKSAIYHK